jgi:hypothetical protein
MLELREIKGLLLERDRLFWEIWCTIHNQLLGIYFQSRNRECWTNGRKGGKSLKQEGFRIPSFAGDGEKIYNDCLEDYLGALRS